jgi:hypothetical protein
MSLPKRMLLAAAFVLFAFWLTQTYNFGMVSPTEQTKSRFLLSYNPASVVTRFEKPWGTSTGGGSSAGSVLPWYRRDVVHSVDFKWYFRPGHVPYMPIVAALCKETKQALIASGAEITSEQLADGRFSIAYRIGKTTGRIHSDCQKLSGSTGTDDNLGLSLQERLSL